MISNWTYILCASLIVAFLLSLTFSCEPQAPRLRSAERKIIDSLYNDSVVVLKEELDSICQISFDGRVDFAVDSIMTERIAERKKRLGY